MRGLLIIGAGGHGKVVAETAMETGYWDKIAFLDERYPQVQEVISIPVLGNSAHAPLLKDEYPELAVALGNNTTRIRLLWEFAEMGFSLPAIVHPRAYISRNAVVCDGSAIFAQAAVNSGAEIGFGCIINTSATVDHDCVLREGVHLSPGVHLGGEVRIGRLSWLGVGASVINRINIGSNVMVGAGSVVINDIMDNVTVVGIPGRVIKK